MSNLLSEKINTPDLKYSESDLKSDYKDLLSEIKAGLGTEYRLNI